MFWWIVGSAVALLVLVAVVFGQSSKEQREANRATRRLVRDQHDKDRRAFLDHYLGDGEPTSCEWDGAPAYIFQRSDDPKIHIVKRGLGDQFEVRAHRIIEPDDVRAVAYEQPDRIEKYTRTVVTPVAVNAKKSAIARGAIGGVLLGPAGMLLGVGSAITPTTKIVEHTTKQQDSRVVPGLPFVVLTTRDREDPIIRLKFWRENDARKWALWIGDSAEALDA